MFPRPAHSPVENTAGNISVATPRRLTFLSLSLSAAIIGLNNISERGPESVADEKIATVAAGLNVILWVGLVIFPFIQVRYS